MLKIIGIVGILLILCIAYSSCVISGRCAVNEEQNDENNDNN